MKLAPIVLFVYNRLWHTEKAVEALQKNILASDSDLIIFSDGFKDSQESRGGVLAVRDYLKTVNGFRSVRVVERDRNYGLAKSIIEGASEIINKFGKIIVLEDDMVSSRYFLQYMNEALDLYEGEDKVISIHGYIYPVGKELPETFFIRGADCWGWATWKRGWDLFESDGQKLLDELVAKNLTREFDFSGSSQYTQMLRDQIAGKNNSWAIRWYASAFLKNKFTLYPGKSLINNIGLDGSGTHCGSDNNANKSVQLGNVEVSIKKIEIKEDIEARLVISDYFRNQTHLWARCLNYFGMILKYVFKD